MYGPWSASLDVGQDGDVLRLDLGPDPAATGGDPLLGELDGLEDEQRVWANPGAPGFEETIGELLARERLAGAAAVEKVHDRVERPGGMAAPVRAEAGRDEPGTSASDLADMKQGGSECRRRSRRGDRRRK